MRCFYTESQMAIAANVIAADLIQTSGFGAAAVYVNADIPAKRVSDREGWVSPLVRC